ncbi:MAG: uncharacterized SAM-binding protein YcdF (DUF218 family) [Candidatus Pseudothioglobus sp.]
MNDYAFFWLSKVAWLFLMPGSWIVLAMLMVWLTLKLGRQQLSNRLLGFTVAFVLLLALLPIGDWLILPLESRFAANPTLPVKVDGIIVLGGAADPSLSAAWKQTEIGTAGDRLFALQSLARRYPQAKLVYTGGSGALLQQAHKGADWVEVLFTETTDISSRIQYERESRNTYENAVFSKALVKPLPGEIWVLITSAFHMPRSVGIFCQQSWPVLPYPVDHYGNKDRLLRIELDLYEHLGVMRIAVREWIGLLAYRLTGKTSDLLAGKSC